MPHFCRRRDASEKRFRNHRGIMLAAMGHMPKHLQLTLLTSAELLARAAEYRQMAETARMVGTREPLLRLAEWFEELAQDRDSQAQ